MSTSNKAYHHGDLREALVQTALAAVEARGAEAMSLREVARSVGVSPAAVYRHFPDKRALLEAIAAEGLRRLGEAQHAAADREPDVRAAFNASGRAYVRFALANPGLFRATFTYPGLDLGNPQQDEAGRLLHAHALALAGGDEGRARLLAARAWALVHGLAMLMLDGRMPRSEALIDAAIEGANF